MFKMIALWLIATSWLLAIVNPLSAAEPLERRWLYLQRNLQVAENAEQAEAILRRAAKVGYNGVVLADYKLNILDRVPEHYFKHARRFKAVCDELKLELIPTVAPIGYSDGLLAHNPNLAEGLPVRQAPFVANEKTISLQSELRNALPGGTFEQQTNHRVKGWALQDGVGEFCFVDTETKHSGQSSLRWQRKDQQSQDYLNARVSHPVSVKPHRQYHARVWVKTQAYKAANEVRLFAMGTDGRVLSHSNLGVKPDQDWTEHHIVFNSLENIEARLYCGTWGLREGTLWMDDLLLEEAAFINLVRRPACPLKVVHATSGTEFVEGQDYAELHDPLLGQTPYAGSFDVYHTPPVMQRLPNSRIKPGDKLLVDFSHTVTVYDNQVCCCLGDPQVFEMVEDQVRRVQELFQPKTYFLSHDEIRVANWCSACSRENQTAGQLLAMNVRECAARVRKVNPQAKLCVWSDMFDPHHNAQPKNFYLVNGDLRGSWEGLPKDITIINWNSGHPAESLPFFTQRGHDQVLAGYYDGSPADIVKWLRAGRQTESSVHGAMYTTWRNNFSDLEAFAKHAWGDQP